MASETERLFPGKFFISTALEALETKTTMSADLGVRYLQRAGTAGILIALFYGACFSVVATFAAISICDTPLTRLSTTASSPKSSPRRWPFIGGGVLIGLYHAFVNDDSRFRP